eukprot:scaffold51967_cov24-Tisochrysis_lutea.AAC.1
MGQKPPPSRSAAEASTPTKAACKEGHQVAAAHQQAAADAMREGAEAQARQQKVAKTEPQPPKREPQSPRREPAKADLKQAPRYLQSPESKARGSGRK